MMPDLTIKGAYEGQCQLLLINERFNALLKTDHGVNHLNLSKQLYQVGFMVPELVPEVATRRSNCGLDFLLAIDI